MLRSVAIAALLGAGSAAAAATCSLTNKCPEDAPCCSQYGECGVGAYCLGGCDPRMSFSLDSCTPAPVCKSKTMTFDKDLSSIADISDYLGDPSTADWMAQGEPAYFDGNVLLTMPKNSVGTVLATTEYMWYGNVKAKFKTSRGKGVVTAFILLSDVKDEIDYEFVGVDLGTAQTNWYFQGIPDYHNSGNITKLSDTFNDFHTYEINWTPDQIQWLVDGQVGRTVNRKDHWNATSNQWSFPQTPARVQISIWPGGLASNAQGTIDWAGGEIDWNAPDIQKNGYFYATFESVTVSCYKATGELGSSSGVSYTYDNIRATNDTVVNGNKAATTHGSSAAAYLRDQNSCDIDDTVTMASPSALPPPSSDKAVMQSAGTGSSGPDPILRNALRYTISPREYAALHKYILSKSRALRRATPSPSSVDKALQPRKGGDDYNAKAVRHSLRVFTATWIGMKVWDAVMKRLGSKDSSTGGQKKPFYKSPALRLSLSLSSILFLYRVLFRFLTRLRVHLLDPQAEPFRLRNPRTTATLTSPFAPAIGASLAGLALGVYPSQQMRVSIAIYALFRALEFGWNVCEKDGLIWGIRNGKNRERPWWFGSWMLQPLAFGQLLHAAVFDPDCFPSSFGDFIFKNSSTYLPPRPENFPKTLKWPNATDVLANIAEMARLNWPLNISPILFPNKEVLPPTLAGVSPLSSQAHPLITSLSCATLHPTDPSCLRTYLTFWLNSFPTMTRFFLIFTSAMTIIPRFRNLYNFPFATIQGIISRALRLSTFATGSISTAWASICFFQQYLPRHVLATQRIFLGGFFAGMWAWVERRHGRSVFLYSARASVDSLWKVGVKRRWWKAMKGGDVWVFVLALMVTGVVYERDAKAIREGQWRKGVSWLRGEGWKDWALEEDGEEEDEEKDKNE